MEDESRQLFREKALTKAFATGELERVQVCKPGGWMALLAVGLVILASLVWGFSGEISVKLDAEGILLADGGGREEAVLFLPLSDKDRVRPQMTVQLAPDGFPPQAYGYLLGTVREVGRYPLTRQDLTGLLQNDALVAFFSGGGPRVLVTVDLQAGAGSAGYAWTTPRGQAAAVSPETMCRGSIVIDRKRPVALLLP